MTDTQFKNQRYSNQAWSDKPPSLPSNN